MNKIHKEACSAKIVGHICNTNIRGSEFPISISVEYYVDDNYIPLQKQSNMKEKR